jgi:hypothetical protein
MNLEMKGKDGTGHKLLTIIVRYAPILVSARDPLLTEAVHLDVNLFRLRTHRLAGKVLRQSPRLSHSLSQHARKGMLRIAASRGSRVLHEQNYFNFDRRRNAGTGHQSLSILFHYVHNLLSAVDPDSRFVALGKSYSQRSVSKKRTTRSSSGRLYRFFAPIVPTG